MPKYPTNTNRGPLLNIASYARRGPDRRDCLSPAEIQAIARTVNRTPEVMVKVLTKGGQDLRAIRAHLAYLNRKGEVEIETDLGEQLIGNDVEKELLESWDLDLEEVRPRADLGPRRDRSPPKLVHKILFSMPPGTPPGKVLTAVKNFAREEFGLKHRYAMVLHTDEPHQHVHMVVKAVSEQGVRLHIKKATLRGWRQEFARHLRDQGIAANATERAVRGKARTAKPDSIYRTHLRGESRHILERVEGIANEMAVGQVPAGPGKKRLLETRREVHAGWRAVIEQLARQGQGPLAESAARFVERMEVPQTEKEQIVRALAQHVSEKQPRWQELTR